MANALLDQQLASRAADARSVAIAGIQDLLARDVPVPPLWRRKQVAVVRNGVAGVEQSFDPALRMRSWRSRSVSPEITRPHVSQRRGARLDPMAKIKRIERGWIYIDGRRRDDGMLEFGTGDELRLNPFEAVQERAQIPLSAALKASVQRLVFWRR